MSQVDTQPANGATATERPRLHRPNSLLAYLVFLPAGGTALALTGQYAQAGLIALLAVQAFLSLKIVDRLAADGFEASVRAATIDELKAKGKAHAADAEQVVRAFQRLPGLVGGAGYLYAVQFTSGVIKIGQTVDPRVRLPKHRRDAEAFGVAVVNFWLSPAHENYQRNETALIRACMGISGRYKNEYFHSLDLATVIALASTLPMKGVRP